MSHTYGLKDIYCIYELDLVYSVVTIRIVHILTSVKLGFVRFRIALHWRAPLLQLQFAKMAMIVLVIHFANMERVFIAKTMIRVLVRFTNSKMFSKMTRRRGIKPALRVNVYYVTNAPPP